LISVRTSNACRIGHSQITDELFLYRIDDVLDKRDMLTTRIAKCLHTDLGRIADNNHKPGTSLGPNLRIETMTTNTLANAPGLPIGTIIVEDGIEFRIIGPPIKISYEDGLYQAAVGVPADWVMVSILVPVVEQPIARAGCLGLTEEP
jgi:hypothetical protein